MEKAASPAVALPPIPAKRYFTIGEVSDLCGVKPHVLRYWEQEFTQLKPVKRRGNRRYYQHHEVLLIRRIRDLLYEQGFTINGARNKLSRQGAKEEEAGASDTPLTLEGLREEIAAVLALLSDEVPAAADSAMAGAEHAGDAAAAAAAEKQRQQGDMFSNDE